VTLVVSLLPNSRGERPSFGDRAFGFESYRTELWGTNAIHDVGARLIPRLATGDLYVRDTELEALELEALTISEHADSIAAKVFGELNPERRDERAVAIRRYMDNLRRAIAAAREHGCELAIW
jgi:hypothetical protein